MPVTAYQQDVKPKVYNRVVLRVQGLDCPSCAQKVEKAIASLPEVVLVQIHFATGKLVLELSKQRAIEELILEIQTLADSIEPSIEVSAVQKSGNTTFGLHEQNTKKRLALLLTTLSLFFIAVILPASSILRIPLFVVSYILAGGEIVIKAWRSIRTGHVFDENFLMTIATFGAFLLQEYPEAVAVMLFFRVGEFFQSLAVNKSRRSITELMNIKPDYANVLIGEEIVRENPENIVVGDLIVSKAGERIPLDGRVTAGSSLVDTSPLTGESILRQVEVGDNVLSGSINTSGALQVQVTKDYKDSTVAKILELVESAAANKSPTEDFITRFARYYTPAVVALAALLAIVPPFIIPGAQFSDWIYRALVFLVISCPCALVISIPLGFFGGIGAASRQGILVKGSNYLEGLRQIKHVIFDKTGTLTKGTFGITKVHAEPGFATKEVLELAAQIESMSNHPIARSIVNGFGGTVAKDKIMDHLEIAGQGGRGIVQGKEILVGNARLLENRGVEHPNLNLGTVVYVAVQGKLAGYILLADTLKEDAKSAIDFMRGSGIKTTLLTGDSKEIGDRVGKEIGINQVFAEMLPHQKVEVMEQLVAESQAKGKKVAFVGDGINDAPVLARADIGIAMGGLGADAAIEAADVVLMTDEPSKLTTAIKISQLTNAVVLQNIALALIVKAIFMTMGAFGIATLWEAVFADVGVTLLAVLNSTRTLHGKY